MTDNTGLSGFRAAPTFSARSSSLLDTLFGPNGTRPVGLRRVAQIYREALPGKRRQKNTAHHPLRHEPAVQKWLQLNQLALFTPAADSALASIQEQPGWSEELGPSSVFAALPGDQVVPLVRIDIDLGRQIRDGLVSLPYSANEVAAVAALRVPIERVQAAAGLDAHAVMRYLERCRKGAQS